VKSFDLPADIGFQILAHSLKYDLELNRERITIGVIDVGAPHNIGGQSCLAVMLSMATT